MPSDLFDESAHEVEVFWVAVDRLARNDSIGTASKVENKLLGNAVGVEDEAAEILARTELIGTAGKVEKTLLGSAVGAVVGTARALL